jgi:hypothetical protein
VLEVADWICRCPHDPTSPLPVPLDSPLARKSPRLHPSSSHADTAALSSARVPPDEEKDAVRGEDPSSSSGHISEGTNLPRRTSHARTRPTCHATVSNAILAIESQLEARISAGVSTPAHETPTNSATLTSAPPITTIPVLNLTPDGTPLTHPLAITGPDAEAWLLADCAELRKLFLTLQCLVPTMNPNSKPTCFKRVVKEKWDHVVNKIKRRARGTAGGDRITVPCPCSTPTASTSLVKMMLDAVVSEAKHFGTVNIADHYLGADLPPNDRPSLKIYLDHHPPHLLTELGLDAFVQTDKHSKTFARADIVKTVAGLPQSGLLSQLRLISRLNSCGHYETSTQMLFKHVTRDIAFVLVVVDDFGVKHDRLTDYHHLVDSLKALCAVTGHARCLSCKFTAKTPCAVKLPANPPGQCRGHARVKGPGSCPWGVGKPRGGSRGSTHGCRG